MLVSDIIDAALSVIGKFSPLIYILAVISFADILISFVVSLLKKLPDFDDRTGRRSR